MTTTTSATSAATATSALTSGTGSTASTSTTDASDRFLKLLVTQMQNQDPLNPMDNAQVTSQMAQINTVTGIDKLNTTMTGMSTNFSQLQMLQGAGLVNHTVLLDGNKLNTDSTGAGSGAFELSKAASSVRIDVLDAAGVRLDTISQTDVAAGKQGFTWTSPTGKQVSGLTFKVTATTGNQTIAATPYTTDTVDAVSTSNGSLNLELRYGGTTAYSKVKAMS
jgi:flagellar basal-body rod modification protein FlgD